jgi:type I restriction enzyme S subunit
MVPPGSVLFACIGFSTGKVSIACDQVITNQQVNSLIPNAEVVHAGFAYYLLRYWSPSIRHIASGSTTPIVNKSTFESFEVSIPGLREQQEIGSLLGALDDKIAVNDRITDSASSLIAAAYNRALKREGTRLVPVIDVVDFDFGLPFSSKEFNSNSIGLPLLRIRDLKTYSPQIFTTERLPGDVIVQPGDVVAGMDAEFRASFWFGEPVLLNQRVLRGRPRFGASPALVRELLHKPFRDIESQKSGTTVIHLNKSDINKALVELPAEGAIKEFEAVAEPLRDLMVAMRGEARTLALLRDSLLPRLISGELKIRDGERRVSDVI